MGLAVRSATDRGLGSGDSSMPDAGAATTPSQRPRREAAHRSPAQAPAASPRPSGVGSSIAPPDLLLEELPLGGSLADQLGGPGRKAEDHGSSPSTRRHTPSAFRRSH
jgi:hypothetical protein